MHLDVAGEAFILRPLDPTRDIPGIVRLLTAAELVDWEGEETSEDDLREGLTWPNHDPVADRWVVEAPDEPHILIGYGLVWAKTPDYADIFVAVHPSFRRRGLGTELLAQALSRARQYGVRRAGVFASTYNAAAQAFLYSLGWRAVSSYWDLLAPPDLAVADPLWPPDFRPCTFEERPDTHLLVDVLNRAYGDLWSHGIVTSEWVSKWLPTVPPENILFVFDEQDQPAGISRFHREGTGEEKAGYIDAPGVVPQYRGARLYEPLVKAALRQLWAEDRFPVRMESWGDDPGTIDLYTRLGFSAIKHSIAFAMDVPSDSSPL